MRLIFPKTFCEVDPTWPFFFLGGPVAGGDDWQVRFCWHIHQRFFETFYAVIPYEPAEKHGLAQYRVESDEAHKDRFQRLIPWERHYMSFAARTGCLVFYLPQESRTKPRQVGDYAQDTRAEIGRWESNAKHTADTRLVIGGERGFPGLPQIKENLDLALGVTYPDDMFPFHEGLNATVEAACEMIEKKRPH